MNMISPQRQRLVVIGNGMAGMRTVSELLARTPHRYDITVFGAEPHPNSTASRCRRFWPGKNRSMKSSSIRWRGTKKTGSN